MRRVTIKDIAEHLQLSVSTVSRALADDKNIRKETKEKIFNTAREMGYLRNEIAANLRTGKSSTVGVIVNELESPYAATVLKGIHSVLDPRGIYVVNYDSDNDPGRERMHLKFIIGSQLAGIISIHLHSPDNMDEYARMVEWGVPLVFIAYSLNDISASMVGLNAYDKAFYIIDHIICSGKRRIVNVKGPSVSPEMADLERGYQDALKKFKLSPDPSLTIQGGLTLEAGREVAERLLKSGVEFDGIFAPNELVATGIMNRLREAGKKIPEDVAIACFTSSSLSEWVYPALTSVDAPLDEMGRKAAELVLEHMKEPNKEPVKVTVDARIKLRPSSHRVNG